jgi:hypothetical protein
LLAEQLETQERVHKALRSVTIIEVKMEDRLPQQVTQLEEVIQQLQQCIMDLELHTVPETPQEIRDLREATARSAVDRLKTLASECRQLSTRSAQTYETLTENPELQTLEAQLHEAKAACRCATSTTEVHDPSRKNEKVRRAMHNPTTSTHAAK